MDRYRHSEWKAYRERVLSIDDYRCVRCHRTREDGAVLQVHHKAYEFGRRPWEYALLECETLCKGCHAEEHGHIMPRSGWHLVATDDLDDLSGQCELCGTSLRYVFAIVHPAWGSMAVGTDCCDKLTGNADASQFMDRFTKRREKLARFIESSRWKKRENGVCTLSQAGSVYRIESDGEAYKIAINGEIGRRSYDSVLEARKHIFTIIESGEAAAFITRQRRKRSLRTKAVRIAERPLVDFAS